VKEKFIDLSGVLLVGVGWFLAVTDQGFPGLAATWGVVPSQNEYPEFRLWRETVLDSALGYTWGAGMVLTVVWYAYACLKGRVVDWRAVDHRPYWLMGFAAVALVAVYAAVFNVGQLDSGDGKVALMYFVNGCGVYWVMTGLFSPARWKYTPVGARWLRGLFRRDW